MAALEMTEQPRPFHELGTAVRQERKRLLDELRQADSPLEAREKCAVLLLSGDEALDKLPVSKVIAACRGVGDKRVKALLDEAEVHGGGKVGDLLARDALRLAATLRGQR